MESSNGRDAKVQPINGDLEPEKEAAEEATECVEKEEESESDSLLQPRSGGIAKGPPKVKRKVRWNDFNGNKLAEVLEFQPSDVSDSDDDDVDTCFCTIM